MYQSMYDGTLARRGPWEALVTFQQLLILCDHHGVVDIHPEVISRRTLIPLDIIEKGIEELSKPDPESRRSDEDGRRIVPIDPDRTWGWKIVNYSHYRSIRDTDERREYQRNYMRQKRAKTRKSVEESDTSSILENIPLNNGEDWPLRQSFAEELQRLYPNVDVAQTAKEIRGWCLANPTKRKTATGVRRFVNAWMAREQNHG